MDTRERQQQDGQAGRRDTAEDSRDTAETNLGEHGEGISNRGIDADAEQASLPPRGDTKDEARRRPTDIGRTSGGGNLGHGRPDGEP